MKERCDDVEDDDNAADNAEQHVVGELTDGVAEGELGSVRPRSVNTEFSIVIIIEVEPLEIINTVVVHRVVEEKMSE